jgi:hypothetical protein
VLFRLPLVVAAVKEGKPVYVCEGEKDVLVMERAGFVGTCNVGGAGKWRKEYSEPLRGAEVVIIADKDGPGRKHAADVASKLDGVTKSVRIIELPDIEGKLVKDAADYFAAGGGAAELDDMAFSEAEWHSPKQRSNVDRTIMKKHDDLQAAIRDPRPKVCLPGADRLLSDFAAELAQILRDQDIFYRNGEIVILTEGDLKPITPQGFRCWAEQFFVGYRAKTIGENCYEFDVTMSDNEARGTLAAPQFIAVLRRVRRVTHARLPFLGKDGNLALLPNGYHAETHTLTLADLDYALDMGLNVAVETINDLLAEFSFADGERSKAVAVAGMVGLYANLLLPEKSLRPCFIFVANAEGAGKSTLAKICIAPTLGAMPTGCKSNEEDEIRKLLTTAIREGSLVIFFDNFKGKLSSPALEAFLSAPVWRDRKLGVNETVTGENLATCFVTGNGMTVSPDMRRRSLVSELHLEAERAEDKSYKRDLELPQILALRPQVLAALWALVREWDTRGRSKPSRGHSAFPHWANVIGGIVQAAGFACPLLTPDVISVADPDSEDMRKLVSEMAKKSSAYTFNELTELAREHGLFESLIGTEAEDLNRREKSAFSKLLGRYDRRMVLAHRFLVKGKGRTRKYVVEFGNGGHGGNGVSDEKSPLYAGELGRKDHDDHDDHDNDLL